MKNAETEKWSDMDEYVKWYHEAMGDEASIEEIREREREANREWQMWGE
jgi:hypothetical protein